MIQEPVTFRNRRGDHLFGILEQPDNGIGDVAVLLLSPGVKMRVGPQRLYRGLSRTFVELGLPVLRFDYYGLGDSEGEVSEAMLRDVYNHIEVGRFVGDTLDAMDWMERTYRIRRFILAGLCGGAVTGLLSGARDPRALGLVGLGITPVLASQAANPALYMTRGELSAMRRSYLGKVLRPGAWLRLLTLRSDYTLLWRALSDPLRRRRKSTVPESSAEPDNANPLFPPAFFAMAESKRPMLLVFGGSDRLHWEFEEKFAARHSERLERLGRSCRIHVIPDANHTLSFPIWQQEMLDVTRGWLTDHFPDLIHSSPAGTVPPHTT